LTEAISRLEYTVKWRRTVNIDDVEAMAKDCGAEVSYQFRLGSLGVADSSLGTGRTSYLASHLKLSLSYTSFLLGTVRHQSELINQVFMVERAKDLMTEGQT
jgi:hypothetical protein